VLTKVEKPVAEVHCCARGLLKEIIFNNLWVEKDIIYRQIQGTFWTHLIWLKLNVCPAVKFHTFLTSVLDGGEWPVWCTDCFTCGERVTSAHYMMGLLGLRANLNAQVSRKIFSLAGNWILVVQLLTTLLTKLSWLVYYIIIIFYFVLSHLAVKRKITVQELYYITIIFYFVLSHLAVKRKATVQERILHRAMKLNNISCTIELFYLYFVQCV
jgi:hypothetical protein